MKESGTFTEHIDEEVDKRIIDRRLPIKEFRKAYEPDGMTPEELLTFGCANRTLTQFVECEWKQLASY